jgi:hypothetical protein
MAWLPAASVEVASTACPLAFRVAAPIGLPPSVKVTVPVGVPVAAAAVTVAVKVAACPANDGFTDEDTVVVAGSGATTVEAMPAPQPLLDPSPL